MKRVCYILLFALLLSGCGGKQQLTEEVVVSEELQEVMIETEEMELQPKMSSGPNVSSGIAMHDPESEVMSIVIDEPITEVKTIVVPIKIGKIAYNSPDYLTVGKASIIEVRISQDINATITEDFEGTGEIIEDRVRVTNRVRVKLISTDDVDIVPIEPEEQAVEAISYTLWTWSVTPQSKGVKTLKIRIGIANIDPDDPKLTKYVPGDSFELSAKSNLRYTFGKFWNSNWKWLFSTILVPIFFYYRKKIFGNIDK